MADVRTRRRQPRTARGYAAFRAILADPHRARVWSDHFDMFGYQNLRLRTMREDRLGIW